MRRPCRAFSFALAVLFCLPEATPAQPGAVGIGVGVAGRGRYPYGGFGAFGPGFFPGYYPGAYRGFYSNGFSLYGPPFPTNGPTPGFFGGSDQRHFADARGFLYPFGVYVPIHPSPALPREGDPYRDVPVGPAPNSLFHRDVYPDAYSQGYAVPPAVSQVAPPPTPAELPAGFAASAEVEAMSAPVMIEVRVPADAVVHFDGRPTGQGGAVRHFSTPPLTPGQAYEYDVSAAWGGVSQSRRLTVRAGERPVVDFAAGE